MQKVGYAECFASVSRKIESKKQVPCGTCFSVLLYFARISETAILVKMTQASLREIASFGR